MQAVVLFDGDCAFCNASVRWIQARDRRERFRFVPLQSPEGRTLAPDADGTTIVLVDGPRVWTRSGAAIEIGRRLGLPWSLAVLARGVPRPLRDGLYDVVARNRHRPGGRQGGHSRAPGDNSR
jgi:predicted DCC family thiol-disulfide oxidoreductase YuxK